MLQLLGRVRVGDKGHSGCDHELSANLDSVCSASEKESTGVPENDFLDHWGLQRA